MKKLYGKTVLITGAAAGIGKKMAEKLGKEGCKLIVTDIQKDALSKSKKDLESQGVKTLSYELDITDYKGIKAVREKVIQDIGHIDILINNAGIVQGGPFTKVPIKKHEMTYNVNIMGLVNMTHVFLDDLVNRSESHLVNIASASGRIGLPYGSTYASSKWAVIGFSESIRLELAELGNTHVGVTTVCPGYIDTGMFEGVHSPILMPMLKPDEVANGVIDAIKTNRAILNMPFIVETVPLLQALLPGNVVDIVSDILGVTSSMKHWKGKY
jgi:short-subunit dehydrogenase